MPVDVVVSDDCNADDLNDDHVKTSTKISELYTATNCNTFKDDPDIPGVRSSDLGTLVKLSKYNELNYPGDVNLNTDELNEKNDGKCIIISETESCKNIQVFPVENQSSIDMQSMNNIKLLEDNCFEIRDFNEPNNSISKPCDKNTFIEQSVYDELNNPKDGEELSPYTIIFDDLIVNELINDNDVKCKTISEIDTTTSLNNSYDFPAVVEGIPENFSLTNIQRAENLVDIKFLEEEKYYSDEKYINTQDISLSFSKVSEKIENVIKTLDYNELNNPGGVKEFTVKNDGDNGKYIDISKTNSPEVLKVFESHHGKEGPNEDVFDGPSKLSNEKFSDCISSIESFVTVDSSQTFSSCSDEPFIALNDKKHKKKKTCSIL